MSELDVKFKVFLNDIWQFFVDIYMEVLSFLTDTIGEVPAKLLLIGGGFLLITLILLKLMNR